MGAIDTLVSHPLTVEIGWGSSRRCGRSVSSPSGAELRCEWHAAPRL
jgi:hypothetical protein